MTFVSYAQNFEDVLLWRALHEVGQGSYIDIGAQDPEVDSVSLAFFKAGWRGIHVEPTPAYAAKLRDARPGEIVIEAAVTDAEGPIQFFEIPETGISTGRSDIAAHHKQAGFNPREIFTPTVRLDRLLSTVDGEIHWMKIDVEGMEADVLRSWGKSPVRPWILVIESTFPNSERPTQQLWMGEVQKRGYSEAFFDGLSRYFVHEMHAELAERLNRPANVFDAYQIAHQHVSAKLLREELEQSSERIREHESDASTLRSQLVDAQQCVVAVREEVALASKELASARQAEAEAARELAEAAKTHAARIEAILRESRAAEQALRDKNEEAIQELRLKLEEAKTAEWSAVAESARLQERTSALAQELERNHQQLHEARASLQRVEGLISAARSGGAGWWQRLGEILGLARSPQSWRTLFNWSVVAAGTESLTKTKTHEKMHMSMVECALGEGRNPYLRANSLAELLTWDDVDFVRCAYVTVLGRQPDEGGEFHFTNRLRMGDSKYAILWNLRRSDEGPGHDPGIAGLDRTLRREALRRNRLFGWLVRAVVPGEGVSREDRRFRQVCNRLALVAQQQSRQAAAVVAIRSQGHELLTRLDAMSGQTAQLASHAGRQSDEEKGAWNAEASIERQTDNLDLSSRERFVLSVLRTVGN